MIEFVRIDKMAIHLNFNTDGLDKLINNFRKVLDKEEVCIKLLMDLSVISLKKHYDIVEIDMHIDSGKTTTLYKKDSKYFWTIENEELETAIEQFEKCKKIGYFSPPEFMRVKVPKNKSLDYMYCKYKI